MKQSRGDTTCAIAGHISFINIAAKKWIAIIEKKERKLFSLTQLYQQLNSRMYFSKKEEDEIPMSKSFAGSILHDVQPCIKGRKK